MPRYHDEPPASGIDTQCTGAGCPKADTCARVSRPRGPNHYLFPPYNKDTKRCVSFRAKMAVKR